MQLHPRTVVTRARAAAVVLAVTAGLTVAPALITTADAAPSASSQCTAAQAALTQAQKKQAAAEKKVAKAKKAVAKAKKAKAGKSAKVKKAKKGLAAARKAYAAAQKTVSQRKSQAKTACATPPKPPASDPQAVATGKKLGLLGLASGSAPGDLDVTQLTALLEQLLPGVTDQLDADQLAGLLSGFNAGSSLEIEDALAMLTDLLDPSVIIDLVGGSASPEDLAGLIDDIIVQLSSLGGGLPIPSGFDPAGLWDTFAGIFGTLSADQLGSLLALVTSGVGLSGDELDLDQLTDLIDSLVPGISEQFDSAQLASMLAGVNGGGLSPAALANLLGGQFSPAQLLSVINGTAGQALLGNVLAQVMAQLGTAGAGGLELPGPLSTGSITSLISTVTNLFTSVLGGGGVLPVVCGLIPLPGLCP